MPGIRLSLLLCACGGAGSFTGTVQMNPLIVRSSAFVAGSEIWLSSTDSLCSRLKSNQLPKGGTLVKIIPHPGATGDFMVMLSVLNDHTASMSFSKLDANCNNTLGFGQSSATAGTLKIDRFDPMSGTQGTFDVTFGDGDHATGWFSATYCGAPTSYPSPECAL